MTRGPDEDKAIAIDIDTRSGRRTARAYVRITATAAVNACGHVLSTNGASLLRARVARCACVKVEAVERVVDPHTAYSRGCLSFGCDLMITNGIVERKAQTIACRANAAVTRPHVLSACVVRT